MRDLLEPVSGRTAWHAFTALWPIDVALAQLCVVLGDHTRAHAYLDAVERICERENLAAHRARVALYRVWALRDGGGSRRAPRPGCRGRIAVRRGRAGGALDGLAE